MLPEAELALKRTGVPVNVIDFPNPLIHESGVRVRHRRITWIPRFIPQPDFRRVLDPLGFVPSRFRQPGIRIMRDRTRLLLNFKNRYKRGDVEHLLQDTNLVLEDFCDETNSILSKPGQIVNHTMRYYWVRSRTGQNISQTNLQGLAEQLQVHLNWIGPLYQLPDAEGRRGLFCPLPDTLIIKPTIPVDERALAERLTQPPFNLKEVEERSRYGGGYRYFVLRDSQYQNVYEFPRLLKAEKALIQEVLFENVHLLSSAAHIPSDPYYSDGGPYRSHPGQWNMRQIKADQGWDISKGDQNIIVCVLDHGCDLDHPDLQGQYVAGYNLDPDSPLRPGETDGDLHGTPCAGIIAAAMDNLDNAGNPIGVAGLAPACKIMPVAFPLESASYIAQGIRYAAENGARVISMSYSDDTWAQSDEDRIPIENAIMDACTPDPAKNWLGVVLCICAHNDDREGVRYPGKNPLVMTCGAADQDDYRKNPKSSDGECWGSNYGEGLSVMAPGVLIPTTDNIGTTSGYNQNGGGSRTRNCVDYPASGDAAGEYFFLFNGSSAATPHVAGLAALILSLNPALTSLEVRAIIEQTADKIHDTKNGGIYAYDAKGWNKRVGFGRINVAKALRKAAETRRAIEDS